MEIAVASVGISQCPLEPVTCWVYDSSAPIGVDREPTVTGAGRVSKSLHGSIATNTALVPPEIAALALGRTTPAPMTTATAAPTADHLVRCNIPVSLTEISTPSDISVAIVDLLNV
jgi:hypothetical protein